MSDAISYVYALRDMAGHAADKLRAEIATAQEVLDRLDKLAEDAEHGAELMASSDQFPNHRNTPPESSGLIRASPDMAPPEPPGIAPYSTDPWPEPEPDDGETP